jgi:uncharacterized protein (DUF58 family)
MPEPLIQRDLLEKLERLTLEWQKSFNGLVGGHSASHFAGPGQEFLDHRNFHAGDDVRSVNWRAYLRFERFFLKTFHIEPRIPVRVLLDVSQSMSAGVEPGQVSKFEYARKLTAALLYVGLVRLETMVVQPFSDGLHQPFTASGGRHRFQPAEAYLQNLHPAGATNFSQLARHYLERYPQRGLTIVISDFLDDADCLRPLQYIADFGHELRLVQLWTPEDRQPSATGVFELVDCETGLRQTIELDDRAREDYLRAFTRYSGQVESLALRNSGRYLGFPTTAAIEDILFGTLASAN